MIDCMVMMHDSSLFCTHFVLWNDCMMMSMVLECLQGFYDLLLSSVAEYVIVYVKVSNLIDLIWVNYPLFCIALNVAFVEIT